MNFKRKAIAIFLISIFLLSAVSASSASDDIKYTLTEGIVDLFVNPNGLLHVNETIKYHFDSSANGVYRDIKLKDNQTIENLHIFVEGAYGEYQIIPNENTYRIKVYLYTDKTKAHKINPESNITIHYIYDFTHVVKIYKDTGELHYKLWGEEWDTNVHNFKSTIHFPNKNGIEYWINPHNQISEEHWNGNNLVVSSEMVGAGNYLELRSSIPLSEFNETPYAQHINSNGLAEIKKIQQDYENSYNFANNGLLIGSLLCVLSLIIPILIYVKFGREPEISYNGIYEREPPTKDHPVFVNAMESGIAKSVGRIDNHGFQAAIMDLINRKFISISEEEGVENSALMSIEYDKIQELTPNERMVINILKIFEENGVISLKQMKEDLRSKTTAKRFNDSIEDWKRDFRDTYLPKEELKTYYINDGEVYMKVYAAILSFIGGVFVYFSLSSTVENSFNSLILSIIAVIAGIVVFILPGTVGGRFTPKGFEYHKKWKNFKKFLKDNSLIKEHPPESIVIWNEYLVYATALGVADSVYKAMKTEVYVNDDYYNNSLFMFYYFGGHYGLSSAISTGISTATSNDGAGGVGGGSGGGGGGAF